MSDIQQLHNIIIIDNKNGGNYVKMIDAFKPKQATKCFVTIDKFQASIDMEADYNLPTHNVILSVNGVQNSYVNDSNSNIILRSQIVDSFMTDIFRTVNTSFGGIDTVYSYAIYNCLNNKENWLEINANDLNNFTIALKSASSQSDLYHDITYSEISGNSFQFFLHLKINFE